MANGDQKGSSTEERMTALERRLKHLEDVAAIRHVLVRYCHAFDTYDLETLSGLFAADATLKVVPWGVEVAGRDAITEFYRPFLTPGAEEARHNCANISIEAAGDSYRSFCYFHETAARDGQSLIGWGTYEDVLTQEAGAWKFQHRLITILALTPIEKGWAGPDKVISV
jgi:ketosteroid isomerase-like protein